MNVLIVDVNQTHVTTLGGAVIQPPSIGYVLVYLQDIHKKASVDHRHCSAQLPSGRVHLPVSIHTHPHVPYSTLDEKKKKRSPIQFLLKLSLLP